MAFPVIQTTNVTDTGANTSHAINMPAGISVGDLILVFFGTDGDNTITDSQTFTVLDQESNALASFGAVLYKIAAGGDSLTITTSVSEPSSAIAYRIDGWESTFAPKISIVAKNSTDSPDPSIVTPNWVQDDTLYIAVCMSDSNDLVTVYPTNYSLSQLNQNGGANGDCGVGVAGRNYNNPSDDPGVFTLAGGEQWVAWTIAVAPAGAEAPGGWTGTVDGVTNPSYIDGIAVANVSNVDGI